MIVNPVTRLKRRNRHADNQSESALDLITVVSTKIAVAHRQPMFREGLRSVLASEPSFHVVGQATNGHDALSLVRAKKPDLLLIDFEIPDPSSLAVLRQIDGAFMSAFVRARKPARIADACCSSTCCA